MDSKKRLDVLEERVLDLETQLEDLLSVREKKRKYMRDYMRRRRAEERRRKEDC